MSVHNIGVELGDTEVRPVAANGGKDVAKRVGPGCTRGERTKVRSKNRSTASGQPSYLVMVPSMSEITIWSLASQRKMRAVHDATPE